VNELWEYAMVGLGPQSADAAPAKPTKPAKKAAPKKHR
jgi:hypothetical protein